MGKRFDVVREVENHEVVCEFIEDTKTKEAIYPCSSWYSHQKKHGGTEFQFLKTLCRWLNSVSSKRTKEAKFRYSAAYLIMSRNMEGPDCDMDFPVLICRSLGEAQRVLEDLIEWLPKYVVNGDCDSGYPLQNMPKLDIDRLIDEYDKNKFTIKNPFYINVINSISGDRDA